MPFKVHLTSAVAQLDLNVGEEWFEIVADARQVRFNGLGVDMGPFKGDVVTQGLGHWVNR